MPEHCVDSCCFWPESRRANLLRAGLWTRYRASQAKSLTKDMEHLHRSMCHVTRYAIQLTYDARYLAPVCHKLKD